MGYHVLDPAELADTPDRSCVRRAISDAADLEAVAVNRYTADPGEQLPLAYHYHDDQEELFYVLSGTLHVETPDNERIVAADEVFVAEPASPHRAYNPTDADGPVRALAIGAPPVVDVHEYEPDP